MLQIVHQLLKENIVYHLSRGTKTSLLVLSAFLSWSQTITTNTKGSHQDFYYSFWSDQSAGTASMTLGSGGNYTTSWTNVGNFIAGKGWATGSPSRVVCFAGNFNGGGNGFLSLYGWTKDKPIEYYVCENYGQWTPPGTGGNVTKKGSYTSDGSLYTIYEVTKTAQLAVLGFEQYKQYWSVRSQKRSNGTITFANHVAAWHNANMDLGNVWEYQIMATEGMQSTGSSSITVSECHTCPTKVPVIAPHITYEINETALPLTANGKNLKWYLSATGTNFSTTAPTPNTSATGNLDFYVSATDSCESGRASTIVQVVAPYKIPKSNVSINVDGQIESTWLMAKSFELQSTSSTIAPSDLSANARLLWDDSCLYLLAEVRDDTLVFDSPNAYDDDVVDLFIDINNDKSSALGTEDFHLSFYWNDTAKVRTYLHGPYTPSIVYKSAITNDGYVIEAKIPWKALGSTPAEGKWLGLDVMVNDDDNGSFVDDIFLWTAKSAAVYNEPSTWGTARLAANAVISNVDISDLTQDLICVFPNPANKTLFVNGLPLESTFTIYDEAGRLVSQGRCKGTIDIADLETGSYILHLGNSPQKYRISKM